MNTLRPTVLSFHLFGEGERSSRAEFIHCETIEWRSRQYFWEIAPHRHPQLNQVLFIDKGSVNFTLDGRQDSLQGTALICVPRGCIHGFQFAEQTDGLVLTLADLPAMCASQSDPLHSALSQPLIIRPSAQSASRLRLLGQELTASQNISLDQNALAFRRALAEAWLRLAISTKGDAQEAAPDRNLLRRFTQAIDNHYREHWKIDDYAKALGCTQRTLARLTAAQMGMTPLAMVNQRMTIEAQRLLRFTNANCSQVAVELGFDDPSYFSRFYIRNTGKRPSEEKQSFAQ